MDYEDQLQHPLWLEKRAKILQRDWGICQLCMTGKNLNVHHKVYIVGRMAWEYSDMYLITLCRACHVETHRLKPTPILQREDPIVEGFARIARDLDLLAGLANRCRRKEYEHG